MRTFKRKVAYSGKAKRDQLKARRERRLQDETELPQKSSGHNEEESGSSIQTLSYQSAKASGSNQNRYALQFFKESDEEIKEKKEQARKILVPIEEKDFVIDDTNFYEEKLEFPRRPKWDFGLSKNDLEEQENKYFQEYLKDIEQHYSLRELSYFELNLETWRQLWRVLEMSDIILFIVDIRFPAAMFPPSLYTYVTKDLGKDFILVLNKIDLAPAPLVTAWKHYFEEKYPLLKICMFTSLPGYNLVGQTVDKAGLQVRHKKGRTRMAAEGTQKLFEVCKSLVGEKVDLISWESKIKEEMQEDYHEEVKPVVEKTLASKNETGYYQYQKFNEGILTIGCVGHPNVGKSSLMNAIMGKKVVSVSKTPGHTKHFQTIFLTNNVRICDCPGLIFPSKVPKPLQVLMDSYPIAQLKEPYSTIQFLAERLNLVKILKLVHPYNEEAWSAMDICDGWAKKRGYFIAKSSHYDSYRGANSLLRMAVEGKICLCLPPSDYIRRKEYWEAHPDVELVKWIQAFVNDVKDMHEAYASFVTHTSSEEENQQSTDDDDTSEKEDSSEDISSNKFAVLDDET